MLTITYHYKLDYTPTNEPYDEYWFEIDFTTKGDDLNIGELAEGSYGRKGGIRLIKHVAFCGSAGVDVLLFGYDCNLRYITNLETWFKGRLAGDTPELHQVEALCWEVAEEDQLAREQESDYQRSAIKHNLPYTEDYR